MPSVCDLLATAACQHEAEVKQFTSELDDARLEIARLRAALKSPEPDADDGLAAEPQGRLERAKCYAGLGGSGLCQCFGVPWPLAPGPRLLAAHRAQPASGGLRGPAFSSAPLPELASPRSEVSGLSVRATGSLRSRETLQEQIVRSRSLSRKFQEEALDFDGDAGWAPPPGARRCTSLAGLVGSMRFELLSSMVVIANMFVLTVSCNLALAGADGSSAFFAAVETVFDAWYLLELVLRVVPFGCLAYTGPQRHWMYLDTVLVVGSLPAYIVDSAGVGSLRIAKTVKLLRVLRASRMMRLGRIMKQSVQFNLLVNFLESAMHCFLWAVFTAVFVTLTVSLLLLSQAAAYMRDSDLSASPEFREDVLKYFGSLRHTMLTCLMSFAGGLDWGGLIPVLHEIGPAAFTVFILYVLLTIFLIPNVVVSLFIQSTLKMIYNNDRETLNMHMQNRHKYIDKLQEAFGGESVSWKEYHAREACQEMLDFVAKLRIDRSQARKLFQILSAHGKNHVSISSFVIGCIKMKRAATTMDLMEVVLMHSDLLEEQTNRVMDVLRHSGTLQSIKGKLNIRDLVEHVTTEAFVEKLNHAMQLTVEDGGKQPGNSFLRAARHAADLALHAEGGCGIVVAPKAAFGWLQSTLRVDFQVTDRCEAFPNGYMTERLRDVHVSHAAFRTAVKEVSRHSGDDRWPEGHEAAGLPKDGFLLVSDEGMRVLGSARMVGLPTPPYDWDGVGTRHMAGVAVAHALSRWHCVVVVRSDSGRIHGICAGQAPNELRVVGCHVDEID